MISDRYNSEGDGGVPPWSGLYNHRDVILASHGGGMRVFIGGRGLRGGGAVANEVIYPEVTSYYCGIYRELPYI